MSTVHETSVWYDHVHAMKIGLTRAVSFNSQTALADVSSILISAHLRDLCVLQGFCEQGWFEQKLLRACLLHVDLVQTSLADAN